MNFFINKMAYILGEVKVILREIQNFPAMEIFVCNCNVVLEISIKMGKYW